MAFTLRTLLGVGAFAGLLLVSNDALAQRSSRSGGGRSGGGGGRISAPAYRGGGGGRTVAQPTVRSAPAVRAGGYSGGHSGYVNRGVSSPRVHVAPVVHASYGRGGYVHSPSVYDGPRRYVGGWYGGGRNVGWQVGLGGSRYWAYRPVSYGVYLNPIWTSYTYYPDYSVYVAPSARYQVFYPEAAPAEDATALVTVHAPADAELFVQGQHIASSGEIRQLESPALTAGKEFNYDVRARWTENGATVERARIVPVHAGDRVNIDLVSPDN